MNKKQDDWLCPICKFTIWGSKPKCLKCGFIKPVNYWTPGNSDPKWDRYGPYSCLKGGYSGKAIRGEPEGLIYPNCGCKDLEHCPQRHHELGCRCYTCRDKIHKW